MAVLLSTLAKYKERGVSDLLHRFVAINQPVSTASYFAAYADVSRLSGEPVTDGSIVSTKVLPLHCVYRDQGVWFRRQSHQLNILPGFQRAAT